MVTMEGKMLGRRAALAMATKKLFPAVVHKNWTDKKGREER